MHNIHIPRVRCVYDINNYIDGMVSDESLYIMKAHSESNERTRPQVIVRWTWC